MKNKEIKKNLYGIIENNSNSKIEEINLYDNLMEDLGLDSVSIMSIICEIEDYFNFSISGVDIATHDVTTISGLLKMIFEKLGTEDTDGLV